jgi:3,4-dihydroxy-2-butanone 4-phosphate synthase
MTYRLNLYFEAKLTSTELVETSLEQAKGLACAALDSGRAQRAELVNPGGAIMFQRWAVL